MPPIKSNKVIGIVGSRRRDGPQDYDLCVQAFTDLFVRGDKIVSGGCPKGGDRFAEKIARLLSVTITIHHAWWEGEGLSAGHNRNTLIARDCDVLIALVAEDRTGGTEDTVRKALEMGKRVVLT